MSVLRLTRAWARVPCRPCQYSRILVPDRVLANANVFTRHSKTSQTSQRRSFQHLAQGKDAPTSPKTASTTTAAPPAKSAAKPPPSSDDVVHVSISQQRKNDWNIVKRLSGELWPKDDWSTRARVVLGMGLLVSGKVSGPAMFPMSVSENAATDSFARSSLTSKSLCCSSTSSILSISLSLRTRLYG